VGFLLLFNESVKGKSLDEDHPTSPTIQATVGISQHNMCSGVEVDFTIIVARTQLRKQTVVNTEMQPLVPRSSKLSFDLQNAIILENVDQCWKDEHEVFAQNQFGVPACNPC
jgi:hypothetical protein